MAADHTIFKLGLANPEGEPGYLSKLKLLLRAADAIDDLGEVNVHELVLHKQLTAEEWVPSIAVYYSRPASLGVLGRRQHDNESAAKGATAKTNEGHRYIGDSISDAAMAKDYINHAFFLYNPEAEPEYYSVPKLLRRTVGAIESLAEVDIDDVVLQFEVTAEGRAPWISVHYSRPSRAEEKFRQGTEGKKHGGESQREGTQLTVSSDGIDQKEEDPAEGHTIFHVVIGDSELEPGHLSRPKLLRQTADVIDDLGDINVHDLVLHEELTDGKWVSEWVSSVAVYYSHSESPSVRGAGQRDARPTEDGGAKIEERHGYIGDQIDAEMVEDCTNQAFYLTNLQAEPDYFSVPKLLRRTADAIDGLDGIEIDDLVLHTEATADGRLPTVVVYYSFPDQAEKKYRVEKKRFEQEVKRYIHKKKLNKGRKKEKHERNL